MYFLIGGILLHNVVFVSAVQQCESAIIVHVPSLLSLPHLSPPHPSGSSQHWAELPVLYSRLPLVICFTHDSVCMSMPLSPFIPPSPSPIVSTNSCSTSASLLKKLGINLPYDPEVPLLGIYPGSLSSEEFDANLRVWWRFSRRRRGVSLLAPTPLPAQCSLHQSTCWWRLVFELLLFSPTEFLLEQGPTLVCSFVFTLASNTVLHTLEVIWKSWMNEWLFKQ